MTTIREYAAEKGVSYEAVRRQVARYSAELEGHIEKRGKTQILDDFAVAFLDEHRAGGALAVYKADAASELKRLQKENKELSDELRGVYRENAMLSQVAAENAKLLAEAKQTQLALTAAERDKQLLEGFVADAKAEIATLTGEKAQAEEMARLEAKAAQEARNELTAARQEVTEVAQRAAESARREAEEKAANELTQERQKHQEELDARDERIQELENRSLWQVLTATFRKKGKKQDGTEN